MSDFYRAHEKLVAITILGRRFEVPENNTLLRQMQFVSPDIGFGRYCWNGECRYCEITYRMKAEGQEVNGLACMVQGTPGMRVTKAATEIRYNMGDALASAPKDDG
jgi:hypothetical protein